MRLLVPGILSGVALLLGAAILYEAVAPSEPILVETPRLAVRPPRGEAQAAYAPPPIDLFADIDARPLFSPQRKPLPDLVQVNGAAAATSDFELVGVIMGGARAVALLRIKSTATTMSAAVGDLVNGWRVARIDATTVTLRANGGEFTVPLDGPASQPPSAALAPLAPQAEAPVPAAAAPPAVPAPTPPTAPAPNATVTPAPAKPVLPAKPGGGTIAPEALRGAPRDPTTGEPTL